MALVDPNQISSVNLPSMDFVENLAESLAEYGVERDDVLGLNPGVLNFIRYLMSDIEELESEVIQLREHSSQQTQDLKRIRAQRISLLLKLQRVTGRDDLIGEDLSATSLKVIQMHRDGQPGESAAGEGAAEA